MKGGNKSKVVLEKEDQGVEQKVEDTIKNKIPKDFYESVNIEGKWYKRCDFCGKIFSLTNKNYWKQKYCSQKCKVAKELSKKRYRFECSNCGKEFFRCSNSHQEHNFCCRRCSEIFFAKIKKREPHICEFCGRQYEAKYKEQRFCSVLCQNQWQKINFRGESNPRYKKEVSLEDRTKICPICGKSFVVKTAYKIEMRKYCSIKCKRKAFRNSIVQQELAQVVEKLCDNVEVEHVEYPFSFDCFVAPNIVIEMMGDYWHCNPFVFEKEQWDSIQKRAYTKDCHKRRFLVENNYKFLYVWEKDWREDREKCVSLIKQLLFGTLQYCDSFNYIRKNKNIVPSDNPIYFYSGEND